MSLTGRHNAYVCEACLTSSEAADDNEDGLCPGCRSVFRAARMLLQHGLAAEEELIPTLVFARITGRAKDQHYDDHYGSGYGQAEEAILFGSHPALEIIDWVDGVPDRVPIVRVRPFVVSTERHPEATFLKSVRI